MSKTYFSNHKGIAPIVIALMVALVLGLAGAAVFIVKRGAPWTRPAAVTEGQQQTPAAGAVSTAAEQLDELSIEAPQFKAPSGSALPALNATALNVTTPDLPGAGLFRDFSVDTGASYSYKLDIPVPKVELDIPELKAPSGGSGSTGGTGSSGGGTGGSTGGTGGSSQGQVNAANCAQFSSMPSAQYCSSIPDPNGRTLCEQCKAASF